MMTQRNSPDLIPLAVVLMAATAAQGREVDVEPATLDAALTGLSPGDSVRLAPGEYAHFTLSGIVGSAEQPIVISGPTDGSAIVVADDVPCCNTIQIDGNVSHLVLRSLTIDGRGVSGAHGIDMRGPDVHHVTVEDCTFIGHDAEQQTVALSTKAPTSNWIIRGNRIIGAGTGMYLGDSNGGDPFVEGLIEHNLIADTIGYNLQIKYQTPHDAIVGATGVGRTVIRHNVFVKNDRPSNDGDRPNLLLGGFPESGANSDDVVQVYGNVFAHNPREALLQASGRVSIHDNLFLGTPQAAIVLTNHDLPLRRAWIYNNTFHVDGTAVSFSTAAPEGSAVVGNLIFAATAISGSAGQVENNVSETVANAAQYVVSPGVVLGEVDFFPLAGSAAVGAPLDLAAFASDLDHDRDFNCNEKGTATVRGAYSSTGMNPGWLPALDIKPRDCSSGTPVEPGPDAGPGPNPDVPPETETDAGPGGEPAVNDEDPSTIPSGGGCDATSAGPSPAWALFAAALAATRRSARARAKAARS